MAVLAAPSILVVISDLSVSEKAPSKWRRDTIGSPCVPAGEAETVTMPIVMTSIKHNAIIRFKNSVVLSSKKYHVPLHTNLPSKRLPYFIILSE